MTSSVDHGWAPNDRDRGRLRGRLDRLNADATDASVATTSANLRALWRHVTSGAVHEVGGVRVRGEFVYLSEAAPAGASDRRAPAPEHRPPSTRLMARRGIALRLMLTALYEAQTHTAPGGRPDNTRPLANAPAGEIAWTGLVATDAQDALDGKTAMTKQDKQRRHLGISRWPPAAPGRRGPGPTAGPAGHLRRRHRHARRPGGPACGTGRAAAP